MGYATTSEQRELAELARRMLADAARTAPLPPAWDAVGAGLDRRLWRTFAGSGLLGLGLAEGRGGSGGGVREMCVVAEEVGVALPRIPFVAAVSALALLGSMHSVDKAVDGSGVVIAAWETFPFFPNRSESLRRNGSTVDGRLRAVPFGLDADVLVAAVEGQFERIDLTSGTGVVHRTATDAFDVSEPLAAIELSGVPVEELSPADGAARVLTVFAAELVGTARRALDGAVDYAKQRRQFGRPIGSFQAIKHLLADRFIELDAARLLVEWAATALDDDHPDAPAAARTALAAAATAADTTTREALQTHGGIGFTWEHPSHVFLKHARARRQLLGSPAHRLDAVADHVFA
ncbi:acyl-CoA dehydrogenase family protein [Amycolatopsis sp. FDAARGOS 1241]|uniref:acyl-CoA dehydrogenase family protein n=1 Tax=Amycolatopsis sp. FDAARGOS 1241 TaxID=2778070 RepID=UPI0019528CCA|nr:acyl-CoA dehydrogenase [Amycolatopsis sp. FDAARGOS 1241]QRP45675.1 acyl-CoA dehydrogenase family protein [Amycolatopsis sp. FDAARGOS 1241]